MTDIIRELKTEIEQLKLDNEGYKAEARLEKRDNIMLGNQNDRLFKENEKLKELLAELKDENSKLKEHIESLDDIILKLKSEK